jgi:hypothetical protein
VCGPCPVFAGFTLAFALQLRKKDGKTRFIPGLVYVGLPVNKVAGFSLNTEVF